MADKIEGPFGLWPFPVLNAIIEIVELRNRQELPAVEVMRDEQGQVIEIEPRDE